MENYIPKTKKELKQLIFKQRIPLYQIDVKYITDMRHLFFFL